MKMKSKSVAMFLAIFMFLLFSILACSMVIGSMADTSVTVELTDSDGLGLSGGKVDYKGGPVSPGTWFSFGTTGSDGKVSKDLTSDYTYSFRMEYAMTSEEQSQYVGTDPVTISFQTSKVTVQLETCGHAGLSGGKVQYRGSVSPGTWNKFGTTGSDGTVSREMFPGYFWFGVEYKQTYAEKQQDVSASSTVTFTTTGVTLWFSGSIEYRGYPSSGTWFTFTKPTMEMLPGTRTFRFAGKDKYQLSIDVSSCSMEKSIIIAELLDHTNKGIEGGVASYAPGGSWLTLGTTDSKGVICKAFDGTFGNVKVRMTYNQGSQVKTQYQPTNSIYNFQTVEAVVKLIDHAGTGLSNGEVWQGGGYWQLQGYTDASGELKLEMFPGTYKFRMNYNWGAETKWQDISTPVVFQTVEVKARLETCTGTGVPGGSASYAQGSWRSLGTTDASGDTPPMELLPGTYKFRMSYNGRSETKDGVSVALGGTNQQTVLFKASAVTLHYSGSIVYDGGSWMPFTKPSMVLLPGDYRFKFDGIQMIITVPECGSVEKRILVVKLYDHTGKGGLQQTQVQDFVKTNFGGSWISLGQTDANGILICGLDTSSLGNINIVVVWKQGSQAKSQDASNSIYTFQTVEAVVKLLDHNGVGLPGGKVRQGGGYWETHGYTDINGELNIEMFPGNYKLEMSYSGTSQTYNSADISSPVVFQTGYVVSGGHAIKASLGGSWYPYTPPGMELLPGTYTFVFDSSAPGGTTQPVTVTAGSVTNID